MGIDAEIVVDVLSNLSSDATEADINDALLQLREETIDGDPPIQLDDDDQDDDNNENGGGEGTRRDLRQAQSLETSQPFERERLRR